MILNKLKEKFNIGKQNNSVFCAVCKYAKCIDAENLKYRCTNKDCWGTYYGEHSCDKGEHV